MKFISKDEKLVDNYENKKSNIRGKELIKNQLMVENI